MARAAASRVTALVATLVATLVALVLAHDLAFLVRYGSAYSEALVHSGHGGDWDRAVDVVLGLGILLAALAVARLVALRRRAGGGRPPLGQSRATVMWQLSREWLLAAARMAMATGLALTVQENVERHGVSGPFDPAILLSSDYPAATLIVVAVAAAVAVVRTLYSWRRAVLVSRLRAALRSLAHPPARTRRAVSADIIVTSILGRSLGLRAPPVPVAG
jgi:hypothetical protein